jgi:hypothetical protein
VSASTHAPVTFDMTTHEFSQVRDPARSESRSTNKDDAEEDEGSNQSPSTNKDDHLPVPVLSCLHSNTIFVHLSTVEIDMPPLL